MIIPLFTNVNVDIFSDGFGTGFTGWMNTGCYPVGYGNCLAFSGMSSGGSTGLSFGFNDPGGALPVSLLEFNATIVSEEVQINWKTATEINNDYFTIERSINAYDWKEVDRLKGYGNSSVTQNYVTIDKHPVLGLAYYRLTQTDFDGKTTIYPAKKINMLLDNIHIYPNPSSDHVSVELPNELVQVYLISMIGKIIQVPIVKNNFIPVLDVNNLKPGIYYLQLTFDKEIIKTEKIIVRH